MLLIVIVALLCWFEIAPARRRSQPNQTSGSITQPDSITRPSPIRLSNISLVFSFMFFFLPRFLFSAPPRPAGAGVCGASPAGPGLLEHREELCGWVTCTTKSTDRGSRVVFYVFFCFVAISFFYFILVSFVLLYYFLYCLGLFFQPDTAR